MSEFNLPYYCSTCKEEFQTFDAAALHLTNHDGAIKEKFRVDVQGVGENVWSSNGKVFFTEREAKTNVLELAGRWFGFEAYRIVPASTPRSELVYSKDDRIPI